MLRSLVGENANAPGVGTVNLAGAIAGCVTFGTRFTSPSPAFYLITDGNGLYEEGIGTWTTGSPATLARTTVLATSSNTTTPINFAGAVQVFNFLAASNAVYLDNTGKVAVPGTLTMTGGEAQFGWLGNFGQMRLARSNYGVVFRNDDTNFYILSTASGAAYGTYGALRPFYYSLSTGAVSIDGTGVGTTIGGGTGTAGHVIQSYGVGTDLTIRNLGNAAGSDGCQVLYDGTTYDWYTRLNQTTGSWEFVNSGYLNVNATFTQAGALTLRAGLSATTGAFSGTLNAVGAITQNGVAVVLNNSGSYSINISGTSAACSGNSATATTATNLNGGSCTANTFSSANGGVFNGAGVTFNGLNAGSIAGAGLGTAGVATGLSGPVSYSALFASSAVVNGTFYANSDARTKTDVREITIDEALEWIGVGRAVTYVKDGERRAGFIAQDEAVTVRVSSVSILPDEDPRFAHGDGIVPDGHRLVKNYHDDIAYLTAALQGALAKIAALETRISAMGA